MPTPKPDETKDEFMEHCPGDVMDDGTTDDPEQAVAICTGLWDERERADKFGALKQMWSDMWDTLRAGFESIAGIRHSVRQDDNRTRALAMSRLFERASRAIDAKYPDDWVFIYDIFRDGENWYAIGSSSGYLYQYPLTVTDADVIVGERVQVTESFTPIQQTRITRQADGRYRWLTTSATALVNRAGEIDSTALFDDFERQSQEPDFEWPYRCFYHLGEQFRTGQVDYIARWEYGLVTSGLFDDTPLGRAEVEARTRDPDGWRDSIHFVPTERADMLEIGDVSIPVYRAGKFVEVTTAPAADVCSYGTTQTMIEEVNRMKKGDRQYRAFVELFGGDEAKADEWLAQNPGAATRAVQDGAVARTEPDAQTPPEQPPEPQPVQREVEVDDELVEVIADRVFARIGDQLTQMTATLDALSRRMEDGARETERAVKDIADRVTALQRTDDERMDEIRQDMPRREAYRATYRPRDAHASGGGNDGGGINLADIANETLSNMPARRAPVN